MNKSYGKDKSDAQTDAASEATWNWSKLSHDCIAVQVMPPTSVAIHAYVPTAVVCSCVYSKCRAEPRSFTKVPFIVRHKYTSKPLSLIPFYIFNWRFDFKKTIRHVLPIWEYGPNVGQYGKFSIGILIWQWHHASVCRLSMLGSDYCLKEALVISYK